MSDPEPYEPPRSWPAADEAGAPERPAEPPARPASPRTGGSGCGPLLAVLAVIVVVTVVLIGAIVGGDDADPGVASDPMSATPTDDTTYPPGQQPGEGGTNVHTVAGIALLVAAVEEATGSSLVKDAVLYPRYAVVRTPEDEAGRRYRQWYWDGAVLEDQDLLGTSDDPLVDLGTVSGDALVAVLGEARRGVEDPTSWYAVVSGRTDGGGTIRAFASNAYGESTYVDAGL